MNALKKRFDLNDQVILLTGGAGMYGRGLAADLADAGAKVIIASRNLAACKAASEEELDCGRHIEAEELDQGDEASILALLARLLERHGRIDGLVNNAVARTMTPRGNFREECEASMRVNATGLLLIHHHFGQQMTRQGSGSIVNVGSIQGMVGPEPALYEGTEMPFPTPDYFFQKGGLINLTRYYASRLGTAGVRVNCVSPGGFFNGQPTPFVARYKSKTHLGRMGNETDLGGPVVFLLSDAARYITGVNLPVDGGYTAK